MRPLLLALLLASACRTLGPWGQRDDGRGEPESVEPRWGRLKGSNASGPLPPAAFHEENTVTGEWAADGEEEEDDDEEIDEDDDETGSRKGKGGLIAKIKFIWDKINDDTDDMIDDMTKKK